MRIVLEVDPRPQPRPRFSNGRVYTPKEICHYKEAIKNAALCMMKEQPPLTGALHCAIRLWRKFQPTSRRFGDLDNLYKAITDALIGICYKDDSQIVSAAIEKYHSKEPRLEVEITPAREGKALDDEGA